MLIFLLAGHWKNIFEEMNPRPALSRNVCFVKFSDPNEDPCQFQGSSKVCDGLVKLNLSLLYSAPLVHYPKENSEF